MSLPSAVRKILVLSLHQSLLKENGFLSFVQRVLSAHASPLFLSGPSESSCIFLIFVFNLILIFFFSPLHIITITTLSAGLRIYCILCREVRSPTKKKRFSSYDIKLYLVVGSTSQIDLFKNYLYLRGPCA